MKKRKPISMRKIREILRLESLNVSQRSIAKSVKVSRSSVQEYLSRASQANINWKDVEELSDEEIAHLLKGERDTRGQDRPLPDFTFIDKELRRKGVTLYLLWEEYSENLPEAYGYTSFCLKYREWKRKSELSYRKPHQAGEQASVDYAGQTLRITDRKTGEEREVEIFVFCLEASNYLYAEATHSQNSADWIGSNRRALEFFGGSPKAIVPDNLKSGVTSACYYEPGINNSFQDFATHYNIAVLPARVRKPRDKGKVESGVQCVERRILAPLRNHKFFNLGEVNRAIRKELIKLNERKMQGYDCSRKELFESIEKSALQPLPKYPFIYKDSTQAKVNIDYHIEYDKIYYSVPYQLRKEYVEIQASDRIVEIYHKGKRVASHIKGTVKFQPVTDEAHMPPKHTAVAQVNISWLTAKAAAIGAATEKQISAIISSRKHPEQGYRASLGVIRLADKYGAKQLEDACELANTSGIASYKRVANILKNALPQQSNSSATPKHKNLRGAEYYH